MGFLTGPTPPDPAASASAQTNANISTAIANSFLNNPNQVTPQGNLTYTPSGDSITLNDPERPGVQYTIPRYQATQTLSPNQQQLNTQREGAQIGLATTANTQAQRLNQLLGGNVDLSNNPYALGDPNSLNTPGLQSTFTGAGQIQPNVPFVGTPQGAFGGEGNIQGNIPFVGRPSQGFGDVGQQQGTYAGAGAQQFGFGDAGAQQLGFGGTPGSIFGFGGTDDITRSYGPGDFSADRARVEEALYGRLNPQLERERANIEQRLQDQGIQYGSPAYQRAMDDYNRQANDARLAVTAAGGQEQQRMMDMAAQRAGFENAAQMQQFQEQERRGTFFNTAEQQAFAEAQARGQFGNIAQQAAYQQALGRGSFANAAQQAAAQEALARGQFGNAAQQAAYAQALGRGQFANAAQQQLYEQELGAGQFLNAAQQQQFAQAQARGQFANAAQQALYEQQLGAGQFVNAAQQQGFGQLASLAQFRNAAQAQQFAQAQAALNAQNQTRNQYLSEQYAARNQPINEISALLSGSQLSQPTWANWNQAQIPTTDIAGLINQNFAQQSANAQMQSQLLGNIIGAGGRIASSAAVLSDRREKDVGERMGSVFAAGDDGERKMLPIYEFAYKDDPASTRHVGPMAQDVEQIDKGAVKTIRGRKYIQPDQVMGSIMRAA